MIAGSLSFARQVHIWTWLIGLVAAVGLTQPISQAIAQDTDDSRQMVLLIGVQNYKLAPPLKFIDRDIDQMAEVLRTRAIHNYNLISACTELNLSVDKNSMLARLNELANSARPQDRLVIYFSGHGFRGKDGQLYLAPIDCDPQKPEATGVPIQTVRERLAATKAGFTLLILDACHAGEEGGAVSAKDLGEPFRELPNAVTIASSKGSQPSLIWAEKEQSLFSYWLCQALKGHADTNGDSSIDIDELYNYVHDQVTKTSKRMGREQTPVRIVRSGTAGVPVVLRLKPQSLDSIIDDIAQQIAWSVEDNKLSRMAVFEFTEDGALGKVLGAQYGLLGRYCAARLQEKLLKLGDGTFRVADQERVERALQEQKFSVDDLARDDALKAVSEKVGGLAAISLGMFQNRIGRDLGLRCRLVGLETGDVLSFSGGRAKLNDSEWAMLGGSAYMPRPLPPPGYGPEGEEKRKDDVVKMLDQQTTHPLRDPQLPLRLKVMVASKERQGVFERNAATGREEYVVGLKPGEVYSLWVENRTGQVACMRLLVDGLNTLPEKVMEKGIQTYETAPRVNISKARHWVLDPRQSMARSQSLWAINGFVTQTGEQGQMREFKIVDADASVAARKSFTDQIGLITAAFYHEYEPPKQSNHIAGSAPGVGTGFGNTVEFNGKERRDVRPGDLWAVINIRYVLQE